MPSEREIGFAKYWEGKRDRPITVDMVRYAYEAGWSDKSASAPAAQQIPCHCIAIEQDETCPVGYPSLLCEDCDGKGHLALAPCPFCGGRAERIDIEEGENAGGSCVCCTVCQASGNVEFGRKENFVANWNRRAAPAPSSHEEKP